MFNGKAPTVIIVLGTSFILGTVSACKLHSLTPKIIRKLRDRPISDHIELFKEKNKPPFSYLMKKKLSNSIEKKPILFSIIIPSVSIGLIDIAILGVLYRYWDKL